MFCKYCGAQVGDNCVVCDKCGCLIKPKTENSGDSKNAVTFDSNKLLLATLFGIVSLFMPLFLGLIPAIVGKNMAQELQKQSYCLKDCKRAMLLCKISIIFNIVAGSVILLFLIDKGYSIYSFFNQFSYGNF